jgi:hypothetical protein
MYMKLLTIVTLAAFLVSCEETPDTGSSGLATATLMNVTGIWTGSYVTEAGEHGLLTLDITQTDINVTGFASLSEATCFATGFTAGEVNLAFEGPYQLSGTLLQIPSSQVRAEFAPDVVLVTPTLQHIEVLVNEMRGRMLMVGPRSNVSLPPGPEMPCLDRNGDTFVDRLDYDPGDFVLTRNPTT